MTILSITPQTIELNLSLSLSGAPDMQLEVTASPIPQMTLDVSAGTPAAVTDLTPVLDAIAAIPAPVATDLTPVLNALAGIPAPVSTDLGPVLSAIENIPAPVYTDLNPVLGAIAAIPAPVPTDLTPVLAAIAAIPAPAVTDLAPVLSAIANIPAPPPADLAPVLSAIAAMPPAAFGGEIRLFAAGAIPAGWTQIAGEPPSYGANLFALARPPVYGTNTLCRFARAGDGVHCLWVTASKAVGHAVLDEASNGWVAKPHPSGFPPPWYNLALGAGVFATLLDGNILMCSPAATSMSTLATVFNVSTGLWSAVANSASIRGYTGITTTDGRVLCCAGSNAVSYAYSPATNTWATLPTCGLATTESVSMATLPSGQIIVVGVTAYSIFDPVLNTFSAAVTLPGAANLGVAVLLSTEAGVLCLTRSGANDATPVAALGYNEAAATWANTSVQTPLSSSTSGGCAQLQSGGQLLSPGGTSLVKYLDSYTPVQPVQARKN